MMDVALMVAAAIGFVGGFAAVHVAVGREGQLMREQVGLY